MKPCFCTANPSVFEFNMDYYSKEYDFHFEKQFKVKHAGILKCLDCNMHWLMDTAPPDQLLHRIYSGRQLDLLDEWLATGTSAPHLKRVAEEIGTSSDTFPEYPCKAKLKTGEIRDLCILSKWLHHPHISWSNIPVHHFLYSSQILSIEPSEYALSLKNRIAMRNAMEYVHKDLVPLIFVCNQENYFHDLGSKSRYFDSNFLRYKDVKGKDIKAVSQDIKTYANCKKKDDLQ